VQILKQHLILALSQTRIRFLHTKKSKIFDAIDVFTKIDLTSAYWQIALDNHSRELSVIYTTKSLHQINRLQIGMKNAYTYQVY